MDISNEEQKPTKYEEVELRCPACGEVDYNVSQGEFGEVFECNICTEQFYISNLIEFVSKEDIKTDEY